MDLYHSWIYIQLINTIWFAYFWIALIIGGNIITPLIIWFVMSGKPLPFTHKNKNSKNSPEKTPVRDGEYR
ncbi:MAG TPA: hypothetical protein VJ824_13970 [Bacillota bacterium]|nr:hypothetical protein [Bacillota bacterium]